MKCPFRTIRRVRYLESATRENVNDHDETIEFAECLGSECPYFGKSVLKHRDTGGWRTEIDPVCRRVEQ